MNKNCGFDNDDIIAKYQLGILDEVEEQKVCEHLKTCEICRQTLSELESISEGLRLTRIEELPKGFKEKLHNRLIEEQKILYSDSETDKDNETVKTPLVIFREIFPLRRFVQIAAVVAVVLLATGRFGGLNIIDTDTTENSTESMPIAVNRVNPDAEGQQFKAYNHDIVESQAENADVITEESVSDNATVEKIPHNDTVNNSADITVAMGDDSGENANNSKTADTEAKTSPQSVQENSDNGSVSEKNSGTLEIEKSESAPLMVAMDTTAEKTNTNAREEKAVSGGGSSASVTTAESTTEDMAQTPMIASLEYYVNVYSVEASVIENSEYANRVANANGEKAMYLSDLEYTELCEKLGIEPKFKGTRVVDDLNGYSVIIVLE